MNQSQNTRGGDRPQAGAPLDPIPVAEPGGPGPEQSAAPWRPEMLAGQPANGVAAPGEEVLDEQQLGLVSSPKRKIGRTNMALFCVLLIGVALVAFMSLRRGPKAITAAQEQQEKKADTAIQKFLAEQEAQKVAGSKAASSAARPDETPGLGDVQSLVKLFFNFSSKSQVPLDDLKGNPFRYVAGEGESPGKAVAAEKAAAEAKAKAEADARAKRLEQAKADFARLRLQTVINGPAGRQAMINSTVVKVGDQIEGFTVKQIESRRIVLEREGEQFPLEITF